MTSWFAVWHRNTPNFMNNTSDTLTAFPKGFTRVAYVEAEGIDRVFELTNTVERPWTDNPEVSAVGDRQLRSTSVGDVIISDNDETGPNVAHTVDMVGLRRF